MTRAPGFAGVLLAAGESACMGHDKALPPWRGSTFLSAHIDALKAYTDFVLVVAGGNCSELESVVDAAGAFLVVNPQPERGQFSSLQVGLQEVLNRGRDAALITPVDLPPVRPETVAKLRLAFEQAESSVWTIVPEHAGRHGYPIVVGREMITELLQAPVTSNERAVEHAQPQHIAYLEIEDELVAQNINTPQECQGIAHE